MFSEVVLDAFFFVLREELGVSEVAQWVTVPAIKPEDHSSILGTHVV